MNYQDTLKAVDGKKVYIGTTALIVAIVINHFVVDIPGFGQAPYDGPWLFECIIIGVVGYGGRSALKKMESTKV